MADTVQFANDGREFSGFDAALAFMLDAGFAVGPMQRGAPVAAMFGQYIVGKWRNLSPAQKTLCHATLQATGGSYRDGVVFCTIKRDIAPVEAVAAFDAVAQRVRSATADAARNTDTGDK
jgi:hypothetical protein